MARLNGVRMREGLRGSAILLTHANIRLIVMAGLDPAICPNAVRVYRLPIDARVQVRA